MTKKFNNLNDFYSYSFDILFNIIRKHANQSSLLTLSIIFTTFEESTENLALFSD